MPRFRHPLGRYALLLGLVAWVVGWGVTLVQHAQTTHAVCEVHGDLVDVAPGASASADHDGPSAHALDAADAHDHDCAFVALAAVRLAAAPALPIRMPPIATQDDPVPAIRAPRGPPLAFAPKTSPPVA